MNDYNPPDSVPNENEPGERVRERLSEDDTANEPVSEEALVDADAIGAAISDEH